MATLRGKTKETILCRGNNNGIRSLWSGRSQGRMDMFADNRNGAGPTIYRVDADVTKDSLRRWLAFA